MVGALKLLVDVCRRYCIYLLPSEWADQSNPVLCIWMACCITTCTIYGIMHWDYMQLALCVNAVDFEKEIYFWDIICQISE